jgi:hypothetical protein
VSILEITWIGTDGSVWDLLGGTQGVRLSEGVRGLHLPEVTQIVQTSARVPGRQYLSTLYKPRQVDLTLNVGDSSAFGVADAQAWRNLDEAFWASTSSEVTGRLLVRSDTGGYRYLDCRLDSAVDAYQNDPGTQRFAQYPVTLVSDSPFWKGFDITRTFTYDVQPQNYYGGGTGTLGPPFYISASSALAAATFTNPGDLPAYARWTATGPGTHTFGLGAHTTTLPTLLAGSSILVNTDPFIDTVTDGAGNNLWPFVGATDFAAPIPTGVDILLNLAITGGTYMVSAITVAIAPLFRKAT